MPQTIISELQVLVPLFCQLGFDSADFQIHSDGEPPVVNEKSVQVLDQLSADRVQLKRQEVDFSNRFLATIDLEWEQTQVLKMRDLERVFGEAQVSFDPSAGAAKHYVFKIEGHPLQAFLRLTVNSARDNDRLPVTRVSLRRVAPPLYRAEKGAAVRFIVLGDFGASAEMFRKPTATSVWKGADVDEVMLRLLPQTHFDVRNCVDADQETLHVHFSPRGIGDFEADQLLRKVPQLNALITFRRKLMEWAAGKATSEDVCKPAYWEPVPPCWQEAATKLMRSGTRDATVLIADLDKALSAQADCILCSTELKSLQSAWLGLEYFASQLDFSTESRIDVFSCPKDSLVATFRQGVVDTEQPYRDSLPPALVVAVDDFAAEDSALIGQLVELTAQFQVPLAFGSPVLAEITASLSDKLAPERYRYLAGTSARITLRPPVGAAPPVRFEYTPSPFCGESAVVGSGAWTMSCAAALSLSQAGFVDFTSVAPPLPRFLEEVDAIDRVILNPQSVTKSTVDGPCRWGLAFDASERVIRIRGDQSRQSADFQSQLLTGPVLHTLYRLRHQLLPCHERALVVKAIREAVEARLPGSNPQVSFDGPLESCHLGAKVTIPSSVSSGDKSYSFRIPWR